MGPALRAAVGTALGAAAGTALLLLAAGALRAGGSVEARGAGGPGIWSAGGTATLDWGAADAWTLSAADDFTDETSAGSPSETDLAALDLLETYSPWWQYKIGADFSNDAINQILYAGPDLGATYSAVGRPARRAEAPKDAPDAGGDEDAEAAWSLAFDATLHGYDVNLGANAASGVTRKTKLYNGGVPYTETTDTGNLTVSQFYPNLTLSVPLWSGVVLPELLYGHDFYSEDPGTIAYVINHRFTEGNGGIRVGNLVGALYTDTLTASLTVKLGWGLSLFGSFSESQMISPYIWVVSAEANAAKTLGPIWSVKLGWADSVVAGTATPEAEAALTAAF